MPGAACWASWARAGAATVRPPTADGDAAVLTTFGEAAAGAVAAVEVEVEVELEDGVLAGWFV